MGNTKPEQHESVFAAMPGTRREIADRTGLTLGVVRNSTLALRKIGRAHVSRYVPPINGGSHNPWWVQGHGMGITLIVPLPKEKPDDDSEHRKAMYKVHLHIAAVLAGPKNTWFSLLGVPA